MSDQLTPDQIAQLKKQADDAIRAAAENEKAAIEAKALADAKAQLEAKAAQDAQAKTLQDLQDLVKKQQEASALKEKELLAKIDQLSSSKAAIKPRDPFDNTTTPNQSVKKWDDLKDEHRAKIEEAYARQFFGSDYDKLKTGKISH